MKYDLFISHASEDKNAVVTPLAELLSRLGVRVWYDDFSLSVGDSLSRSIDAGLAESPFGLVVISQSFLSKKWPEYELRGLLAGEIEGKQTILPIWHCVTKAEVYSFSPSLADKMALDTSKQSLQEIAIKVTGKVRPDIFRHVAAKAFLRKKIDEAERVLMKSEDLIPGPIRHTELPPQALLRIKIVHMILCDVMKSDLESMITNFCRDLNVYEEIHFWERVAAVFLEMQNEDGLTAEQLEELFRFLLGVAGGAGEQVLTKARTLSDEVMVRAINKLANVVPKLPLEVENAKAKETGK